MWIIGVSKRWLNYDAKHSRGGKKYWHVFGYDDVGRFFCNRVSTTRAMLLRTKIVRLQTFMCTKCGFKFKSVKNSKPLCPNCEL